jgi:two-component system, NarL family, invasion response regulator UvrY
VQPGADRALSAREFEILRLLAEGHRVDDIARRLGLNGKTVANHQSSIRQKLGVSTGAQLVRVASGLGLLPNQGAS